MSVPRNSVEAQDASTEETAMSTLQNRPNTALVVIDVQNGVVAEAHNREVVIGRVSALVDRARAESIPVVWVQHNGDDMPVGSKEWDYVSELELNESEPVIHKSYGDSFEGTNFEQVLSELGIGHVVVAGAETDACIRSTIHGAFTRGYDVTLVSDTHTTGDRTTYGAPTPDKVIAHTNLYWQYHDGPGRRASVAAAKDVAFA